MEKVINPPTIGKRPSSSIIYGLFIAVVLFLLLPLTQLIDTASNKKPDQVIVPFVDDVPEDMVELDAPDVEEEIVEIDQIEEPPPPPTLDMLDLYTNVDITKGFGSDKGAFDFSKTAQNDLNKMIFDLRDVSKRPVPTYQRQPVYPPELKRLKIEGTVVVQFILDESGVVRNARVIRSDNEGFNKNAIDAIRKWKFTAAEKDGKKVKVKIQQPLKFNLK